jgi:cytochrome c biogenesis protein
MTLAGWARWAWRQLTSMRTALVLLFLLALAAVPGSLFPQRGIDSGKVMTYLADHPATGPWLDRLGLFEVFRSPWFSAIYLLLFVSLAGCVIPRSRAHWSAMRARPPSAPRHLDRLPVTREFTADAAPSAVLGSAAEILRRERFRVDRTDDSVSAEKGYLRETGNLVFHVALLLLLVAVAVGHLYGYAGNVLVPVGSGFSNTVSAYDRFGGGPRFDVDSLPPFSLTLDKLTVRYQASGQQQGAPRDFDAVVTYQPEPGAAPRTTNVRVNHPLRIGGTKVFLIGNGYAPRFTVRDGEGHVVFRGPVPFLPRDGSMTSTGVVKVPDAKPAQLGFQGFFLPTAALDPERGPISVFPDARDPRVFLAVWKGDLGLDSGRPQSVYRLDTERMTQLMQGERPVAQALGVGDTMTLPDGLGSLTFDRVDRWATFQIADNPGRWPALLAAGLAIAGLMASLFVRRRRVWVRATADDDARTVVRVGGLARSESDALVDEVDRIVRSIGTSVGVRVGAEEEEWSTRPSPS